MRNDALTATVTVLCGLAIVGTLIWYFLTVFNKDLTADIDLNGEINEVIEVDELSLKPGTDLTYTVNVHCKKTNDYILTLNFVEHGSGTLDDFLDVTVKLDGQVLKQTKLSDLISGRQTISLNRKYTIGTTLKFEITYSMALEVGNEAQGATCDFDMYVLSSVISKTEE